MSDTLENMVYRCIERFMAGRKSKRYGIVTSWDPDTHRAKVKYQPEGTDSGWIPVHAHHMGNGWGIVAGLTPGDGKDTGDLVEIQYQEGDYETGAITSRVHNDTEKAPKAESGEMVLRHKDGAQIKFDKNKVLTLTGSGKSTTVHNADGSITHTDSAGGVVHQANGKVFLGDKNATKKVKLEDDSPATKVFGV